MKPTYKAEGLDKAITELTGIDRKGSFETNECVWCNEHNLWFRDELSRKEYTISGICQDCQDKTFGE